MHGEPTDSFENIVNPELADQESLVMLGELAHMLVDPEPASRCKRYGYYIPETGATIHISSTFEEEFKDDFDETWVSVHICHESEDSSDDYGLMIAFNHDNELINFMYEDPGAISRAARAAQDLLDSRAMDEKATVITKEVQNLLLSLELQMTEGYLGMNDFFAKRHNEHIADLIREATDEKLGDREVVIREFGAPVDDDSSISIITHDFEGEKDERNIDIPPLQVVYEDRKRFLTYVYSVDHQGEHSLEITPSSDIHEIQEPQQEIVDSTDSDSGTTSADQNKLWQEKPLAQDVGMLIEMLVDVSIDYSDHSRSE